jgi:hypothetical protein
MARNARDNWISRRSWLLAGLAVPLSRTRADVAFSVSYDGDNLRVTAPDLHFLTGKPLERLKNADTVVFVAQLTLFSDAYQTVFRRVPKRFIVSYDLWQEKFAITMPGASERPVSHLSASQAESWCIENMAISALGLPPDRDFWLRFDLRSSSQKDLSSVVGDSGISITTFLIDVMSRKPGPDDFNFTRRAGPLRLAKLPRTVARGRIG